MPPYCRSPTLPPPAVNIDRVPGLRSLRKSCGDLSRVAVAVIDGPIEISHPAFSDARLEMLDGGVRAARAAEPGRAHGTHVASILFGRPDGPVEGVVPGCRGLLIPIFDDTVDGGIRPCSEVDLARALMLASAHGANVINISAGRLSRSGAAGIHLDGAIRHCMRAGALVVAAAGNDGCDCLQVPAALPGVLVVGAMDELGQPVGFSNWGAGYRDRGVLAPGTDIAVAAPGGAVSAMSGTSFATPLVAGTAALLLARQIASGGAADARLVMNAIIEGADRCDATRQDRCERFLAGTLNVESAVRILDEHRPNSATAIRRSGKGTGRQAMETQDGPVGADAGEAVAYPGGVTERLSAIETAIGDLARALGNLRPAGLVEEKPAVEPTTVVAAATEDGRLAKAPAPAYPIPRRRPGTPTTDGASHIDPSACCDACAAREARQLVYALGKVGYDFGTEARMDSIQSQMPSATARDGKPVFPDHSPSPLNPADLVAFLRAKPAVTPAITWTLKLDETPIYAIKPEGDYLEETYEHLVNTLAEQLETAAMANAQPKGKDPKIPPPPVERMSLPGIINGEAELMNGLIVPTVRPALAAMYTWSTEALVTALDAFTPPADSPPLAERGVPFNPRDGLRTFLARIYEEMRNVGMAPDHRALNFAATNAYQANAIFVRMRGRNMHIEKFEVLRSPVMRPDADCWDVKMTFYNPADLTTHPREVYFYTIDVSDVVPVAIGKPRHWTTY